MPAGAADEDRLEVVGRLRVVVAITGDRRLRSRPGQRAQLVDHGARVVSLGGKRSLSGSACWFDRGRGSTPALTGRQRPWVQALTAAGVTDLPTTRSGTATPQP